MKRFILLFAIMSSMIVNSNAQNYLEHLLQKTPGLGSIVVTQSKTIDELVNGKAIPQEEKEKTSQQKQNHTTKTTQTATFNKGTSQKVSESQKKLTPDSAKKSEHHETTYEKDKNAGHESLKKKSEQESLKEENNEQPIVDMRKKVMRQSYKVTGYRVQAYAGGNSRNDRLKAEQTGNAIKVKFPDQPVYVHFYSPRWICRVGNFRSLSEAQQMLTKIRALGYKQACLVKGKITVQN